MSGGFDTVGAAAASAARQIAADAVKRATCKRCGSQWVAWVKSEKTGRFYLCEAISAGRAAPGKVLARPWRPHRCDGGAA